MNNLLTFLLLLIVLLGCKNESTQMDFLTEKVPDSTPLEFKPELIPDNKIIHKGIFSPDLKEYYFTISDTSFENFDVYKIEKTSGSWSAPEKAFFNSEHNEHGMSFTPDGKSIYFSSTRPVNKEGIESTWHIWKSDKINGKWTVPTFVDIPNLRDKLVSHPTVANSGTLYFHSSNLDYSEMDIYRSTEIDGKYSYAIKVPITMNDKVGKCTPFISPKEDFIIFATIGNQLDLMISFNAGNGKFMNTRKLKSVINEFGQGNPYVTPDNKFLFYTTGDYNEKKWRVKWVEIQSELKRNK
ncbi:TolB family protein [Marinigracilibium pacificum]|uniref:WD40 repeat protein n=1 Tax=Marinigracilibium pacificum TaxID=2729599 RepID=A0A848IVI1_9BACT|nr:PD40 domain-containing protein [Marinigracilibium pacificum]NMM47696.1 hypothetical protein [Marinigracilibium pacificum]